MSPKKVRRGGKYTTGVKVNRKTGQVYQTTARRGCLSMVLAVVGFVAVLVTLVGCKPEVDDNNNSTPPPAPAAGTTTRPQDYKQANVDALCGAVAAYDGSDGARGNIGLKAEMSGIPDGLKRKGVEFSRGPSDNRKRLLLLECATFGWKA